ncbi:MULTISPECIES: hypothetical protein [Kosmotoga]|uniref:Uncharacterized protein n=1 Tax=Kosmotoga olearia (strain ATCC BAA-1733 / DSM 21960 / TBF 19.5.1) TaxID=521045 RepID=C5CEM8_KOSOT|nr:MULTISPECIES: hypothetical protein [Kosmotoga]ACR80208.1 hypothetical protein Kole_1518 [Kosmotoga olearia TBF 19.5.1]MDI3523508.1 hypothetical protein [Kosmotoga sp.]MDK2952950.1 hypothetical protein [Kosmotoga sp.]OAA20148.1 hypothetical protein DU53_08365 [Kosmotoga sp. DU53]
MQVSLEQLLSALIAKVDALEASVDDLRVRTNITLRLLKNLGKEEIDRDTVKKAVEEEFRVSKEAGLIEDSADVVKMIESFADDIYKWLTGDVRELREKMDEYKRKLEEALMSQSKVIDVAPADFVKKLKPKGPKDPDGGGKILF